jgi:transposase-like protein
MREGGYAMDVSPRRREFPDEGALKRLRDATMARTHAEAELRAAVRVARAAGGSVRVIAEVAGLSTRTVQQWLKDAGE